jgi:hypothetical protein
MEEAVSNRDEEEDTEEGVPKALILKVAATTRVSSHPGSPARVSPRKRSGAEMREQQPDRGGTL